MRETEKDKLYQWAVQNNKSDNHIDCFTKIDKNKESYYEPYEDRAYLMEYTFQTVPELREELQKLWQGDNCMQQIETVVLVAAMKNRGEVFEEKDTNEATEQQLKPYIYNF